jgi:hypothetical protein
MIPITGFLGRSDKRRGAARFAVLILLICCSAAAAAQETAPLRGMYIVSGAFQRGWKDGLGVPRVFATGERLNAALARSVADIKRLGLNTLMIDPTFYAGESFSYEEYAEIVLQQAANKGLHVILGLPVACPPSLPQCWRSRKDWDDTVLSSCMIGPQVRSFVDRFVAAPALAGFVCAYENFGQPNATADNLAQIRQLTDYIARSGKTFFNIPAAGLQDRVTRVFSVLTPQLNPALFGTPEAMTAEVAADAARYGGVEINFWHSQTTPQNGYAPGSAGTAKWHQLQYDAFVRVRPRDIAVFDYQKLIATRDGELAFYEPRGWLMSLLARLSDPSLVLYDPLESRFSSMVMHMQPFAVEYRHDGLDEVMGHGVDAGVAAIGRDGGLRVPASIETQGGTPLVSRQAGTFSVWIKTGWPLATETPHGLLDTPCAAASDDCIRVQIAAGGTLELTIQDAAGAQASVSAPLVGAWRNDAWNHVAATWDRAGRRLALYFNGRGIGTIRADWAAPATLLRTRERSDITIGNLGGPISPNRFGLDGELDELRVYSRALSPDQITALYRSFAGER